MHSQAQVVDTAEVRKKDAQGSRKISVERWILSFGISVWGSVLSN
jgi:hypothetical protein